VQSEVRPGSPEADLEDLCKTSMDGRYDSDAQRGRHRGALIAKLRRIPDENRHADVEHGISSVLDGAVHVRDPMKLGVLKTDSRHGKLLYPTLSWSPTRIKYAKGATYCLR